MKLKLPDVLLILLILLAYLAYSAFLAPDINLKDNRFDLILAQKHLDEIAKLPHPIGTKEHKRVRSYIHDHAVDLGFEVIQETDTLHNTWKCYHDIACINNIIVIKRGTDSNGAIVLAAHYDSQINTPGAADDGAAVANMMSLMEKYANVSYKNDIIFLFTDGEETGLYGAEAFVTKSPLAKEVKYLFNFEARGNEGLVLGFEPNNNNNSIINDFKSMDYSYGNSLMYEIYKLMPNDTDFTEFKKLDIGGIGFALVDGFVNYHSMTDTPENISPNSQFHHGIMMAQALEKYRDSSLENKHAYDVTYFNTWGSHMISYRPFVNLILLLISIALIVFYSRRTIHDFKPKELFKGLLIFPFLMVTPLVLVYVANTLILMYYPHYSNFLSNNFYNSISYFVPYLALFSLGFYLILKFVCRNEEADTEDSMAQYLHIIGLGFISLLSLGAYIKVQTGSYFLIVPLFAFLVIQIGMSYIKTKEDSLRNSISLLPAIILFAPFIYMFFVVFSLNNPVIAVFVFSVIMILAIPLLIKLNPVWRWILLAAVVMGIIRAHAVAFPNSVQPFQANMHYVMDNNSNLAYLVSNDDRLDLYEQKFIKAFDSEEAVEREHLFSRNARFHFAKTDLNISDGSQYEYTIDTVGASAIHRFNIQSSKEIIRVLLKGEALGNAEKILIAKQEVDPLSCRIQFLGDISEEPLEIEIHKDLNSTDKQLFQVSTFRRGLIEELEKEASLRTIIPGVGFYGGTIIHKSHWDL